MKRWPINHLTADDLDAFHSASLSAEAREHLEECEECRSMALLDRRILGALAALPALAPREAFADRVMARVSAAAPLRQRLRRQRMLALAAVLVVGIGASAVWSLLNRALLLSWFNTSVAETGRLIWLGVRVVATNVTAQPWYAPLREFAATPGRLALLGGGLALAYGAAVLALRWLLTPPSRPVPHAHG